MCSCAWNSTAARSSFSSITGNSMVRTTIFWLATPSSTLRPTKWFFFQKDLSSDARAATSTISPSETSPSCSGCTAALVSTWD